MELGEAKSARSFIAIGDPVEDLPTSRPSKAIWRCLTGTRYMASIHATAKYPDFRLKHRVAEWTGSSRRIGFCLAAFLPQEYSLALRDLTVDDR